MCVQDEKMALMGMRNSRGPDQTAQMRSPIWAFAVC